MRTLTHILGHIKHGLIIHALLSRLAKIGIGFKPYIVYREQYGQPSDADGLSGDIEQITSDNLEQILQDFPEKHFTPRMWRERLAAGDMGMLLKEGDQMIGFTWANLRNCIYHKPLFKLTDRQAYFKDTYIVKSHRGKGRAVAMRKVTVAALQRLGRKEFFSITEAFNTSARKFKDALPATPMELRLCMVLFSKTLFDIRLREYSRPLYSRRSLRIRP